MKLFGQVVMKAEGITFIRSEIPADQLDEVDEFLYNALGSGRAQAAGLVESLVMDAEKAAAINLPYAGTPYWWSGWQLEDEIPLDGMFAFEVGPGP